MTLRPRTKNRKSGHLPDASELLQSEDSFPQRLKPAQQKNIGSLAVSRDKRDVPNDVLVSPFGKWLLPGSASCPTPTAQKSWLIR